MYKFVNNAILEFIKNSIEWAPLKLNPYRKFVVPTKCFEK